MTAIALRIDVSHLAGAERAVPAALSLLQELECSGSFFFSLGADRSGLAWRDSWLRRRELGRAALAYGRFWPAPVLARRCSGVIRQVRDLGFECGVMPPSSVDWLRLLQGAYIPESDFEAEILQVIDAYRQIFGEAPALFAAPGNRMNRMAYRLLQRHGFYCVSATEGSGPFWPVANAELAQCLAMPVSLPAFDLLRESAQLRDSLLQQSAGWQENDYALLMLRAESLLCPGALDVLRGLLQAWLAQGHSLVGVRALAESWPITQVHYHSVAWAQGAAGDQQGPLFP
ncbi:polysaccharide deacetylase family protein [Chitinilyticum aquatile]|uniref:polysaccharide deacetylase family protein n=1 Tax=Chitinilyticum aquatile TaxID=362520 RepID=UPI0003FE9C06|nr:polysaccharide deacetylase family protein [Chitinilyticum aquatile]